MTKMKTHSCIYCSSAELVSVEKVAAKAIVEAYDNSFNVPLSTLLTDNASDFALLKCRVCDLQWFSPLVPGDGEFYENLQQHDWYYQEHKPEYDYVRKLIHEGDHVLEVGCGKGVFGHLLAKNTAYHGLEFNHAAVEKAKTSGLQVEVASIEIHADKNANSYDVVCHFQVLEHVTNPRQFLEACVQALKPGGRLIVAVPAEDSFLSLIEGNWLGMPPHHLTRWSDQALLNAFRLLHLEKIELWHESVAEIHQNLYQKTMLNYGFKTLFGLQPRLERDQFFSKIADRLEKINFFANWLGTRGEKRFEFSGRGHTVCAIGFKASAS